MKNKVLLLIIILLFTCHVLIPPGAAAAGSSFYEAFSDGDIEDIIYNAVKSREEAFKIRFTGNTENIMSRVRAARDNAVKRDSYEESSISFISGFNISNFADHADISFDAFQYYTTAAQEEYVDQEVASIVSQKIRSHMSDEQRERIIHDFIISNVRYDEALSTYTAYSALQEGKTVCNGYVQLAYKLLNRAGIDTLIVKGKLTLNGQTRDHAWNLVKIDNHWYHLDITLNDTTPANLDSAIPYNYYNLSDAAIGSTHQFDSAGYPRAENNYPLPVTSGAGSSQAESSLVRESINDNTVLAVIDQVEMNRIIDNSAAEQQIYPVDIKAVGSTIVVQLTSDILGRLAAKNKAAVLRIVTGLGTYELPATGINYPGLASQMNNTDYDIKINVVIRRVTGSVLDAVNKAANEHSLRVLADPTEFRLEAVTDNGRIIELTGYEKYVSRSLTLSEAVKPGDAAGLVYTTDKETFFPVPTVSENIDNRTVAVMKQRGNGLYVVVANPKTFSDVSRHWARSDIEQLASKMVVRGKNVDTFDPDGKVTRSEFAAMLVQALGLNFPDTASGSGFRDVSAEWFANPVKMATGAGLIKGYGDGSFRPEATITRQEMVAMAVRAAEYAGASVETADVPATGFSDEELIKEWARAAVTKAVKANIIKGDERGCFNPDAPATRAEASVILVRTLRYAGFIDSISV